MKSRPIHNRLRALLADPEPVAYEAPPDQLVGLAPGLDAVRAQDEVGVLPVGAGGRGGGAAGIPASLRGVAAREVGGRAVHRDGPF